MAGDSHIFEHGKITYAHHRHQYQKHGIIAEDLGGISYLFPNAFLVPAKWPVLAGCRLSGRVCDNNRFVSQLSPSQQGSAFVLQTGHW